MNEPETPYTETEFLLCILNDDEEGARVLMADMSDRELEELRKRFRTGKWWIEETQSIRYANTRNNTDASILQERPAADGAPQERGNEGV